MAVCGEYAKEIPQFLGCRTIVLVSRKVTEEFDCTRPHEPCRRGGLCGDQHTLPTSMHVNQEHFRTTKNPGILHEV